MTRAFSDKAHHVHEECSLHVSGASANERHQKHIPNVARAVDFAPSTSAVSCGALFVPTSFIFLVSIKIFLDALASCRQQLVSAVVAMQQHKLCVFALNRLLKGTNSVC
jgi:hypothetical protein